MDRWQQVERLYHEARARVAGERAAFLREECGDDEALRREVESLLSQERRAGGFLDAPAVEIAAKMMSEEQRSNMPRGGTD